MTWASLDRSATRLVTLRVHGELAMYRVDLVRRAAEPIWEEPVRFDSFAWSGAFAPGHGALLVALGDGTARMFALTPGDGRPEPDQAVVFGRGEDRHAGAVHCVTFSPDGTLVLTGSFDGTVRLWRTDGTLIVTLDYGTSVNTVGFSPDGKQIFAGGLDRVIRIWPVPPISAR